MNASERETVGLLLGYEKDDTLCSTLDFTKVTVAAGTIRT